MGNPSSFFLTVACFLLASGLLVGAYDLMSFRPAKLFVFGDSYADTGNVPKQFGAPWIQPYGISSPGHPAGRFGDGHILTDYLARFLGIQSPLGYVNRGSGNDRSGGMNFAFGGSGVFFINQNLPNMSTQIDFFQQLLSDSYFTRGDLESAAVLVTCAGNDYAAYLANGGSLGNVKDFIPKVVNQLVDNLRRLEGLGAQKIIVGGLQPLGCLPRMTAAVGYSSCIDDLNTAVNYHDVLLQQAVQQLNGGKPTPSFLFLDLYQAFQTVISTKRDFKGRESFSMPLTPCCAGTGNGNSCGSVDGSGGLLFTLCSDRWSAFFWDGSHPTQAGWKTLFSLVKGSIGDFFGI